MKLVEPTSAIKYNWVAAKVVETTSILEIKATIIIVNITIENMSNWSILLVDPAKKGMHLF